MIPGAVILNRKKIEINKTKDVFVFEVRLLVFPLHTYATRVQIEGSLHFSAQCRAAESQRSHSRELASQSLEAVHGLVRADLVALLKHRATPRMPYTSALGIHTIQILKVEVSRRHANVVNCAGWIKINLICAHRRRNTEVRSRCQTS